MPEILESLPFFIQALDRSLADRSLADRSLADRAAASNIERAGHTPGYSITGRPAADLVAVVYPDPTRPDIERP